MPIIVSRYRDDFINQAYQISSGFLSVWLLINQSDYLLMIKLRISSTLHKAEVRKCVLHIIMQDKKLIEITKVPCIQYTFTG